MTGGSAGGSDVGVEAADEDICAGQNPMVRYKRGWAHGALKERTGPWCVTREDGHRRRPREVPPTDYLSEIALLQAGGESKLSMLQGQMRPLCAGILKTSPFGPAEMGQQRRVLSVLPENLIPNAMSGGSEPPLSVAPGASDSFFRPQGHSCDMCHPPPHTVLLDSFFYVYEY